MCPLEEPKNARPHLWVENRSTKSFFSTKSRAFSEKSPDLDESCYTGVFGHRGDDDGVVFELQCNPGSQLATAGKAEPDEPDLTKRRRNGIKFGI